MVEYNSWFAYVDSHGPGHCCPDAILTLPDGQIVVLEVKLSWVPEALPKLKGLYIPVLSHALGCDLQTLKPLVLVRSTKPAAPQSSFYLTKALLLPEPLLLWLGQGHIVL
jgi:hypothetical protein